MRKCPPAESFYLMAGSTVQLLISSNNMIGSTGDVRFNLRDDGRLFWDDGTNITHDVIDLDHIDLEWNRKTSGSWWVNDSPWADLQRQLSPTSNLLTWTFCTCSSMMNCSSFCVSRRSLFIFICCLKKDERHQIGLAESNRCSVLTVAAYVAESSLDWEAKWSENKTIRERRQNILEWLHHRQNQSRYYC